MTKKHRIPLFQLAAIMGLLVTVFGLSQSIVKLVGRKGLLKAKQEELVQLQKEQENLQNKLKLAQTPEFIEKEAREKLNLAKIGETIILVEEGEIQAQTNQKETTIIPNWKKWWQMFF
ncbi:MAG: Septum formation initiator family protein [Microgenomates group bacterium GW2011_GWC1_39_12]|nr:MAG: Septum formation initiator family protein [Microgenomates group bacterium GW2011_GWC1_39_12]